MIIEYDGYIIVDIGVNYVLIDMVFVSVVFYNLVDVEIINIDYGLVKVG